MVWNGKTPGCRKYPEGILKCAKTPAGAKRLEWVAGGADCPRLKPQVPNSGLPEIGRRSWLHGATVVENNSIRPRADAPTTLTQCFTAVHRWTTPGPKGPPSGIVLMVLALRQAFYDFGCKARPLAPLKGAGNQMFSRRTFHALRHSFPSALAHQKVAAELRRQLTGHKTEGGPRKYPHHELDNLRTAMKKLPSLG